ncbi:DNA segregation ATPase FtsK/SpoIIIE-like protein [Weissella uvarum]|uniref:DNA translocase FtsK n=1 Tax=Weissella uvarum TaxID=1479233 RepID=UPI001960E60F|nr:DNA translocase FtsK [Weissella uvarum]MBM7617910.1 DNA segregation ATPase FtsK/SpoIIIE-like protein [Weissella uvarum]MCM0596093.1 hypothetical protein [Weissella uvarum]
MINFSNAFKDELAPSVFQFMLDNAVFEDQRCVLTSVPEIMRHFKIGYNRACWMVERLMDEGIVSEIKVEDSMSYSKYELVNKYLVEMLRDFERVKEN